MTNTQKLVLEHIAFAEKIATSWYKKTPPQVRLDELKSAAYMGLCDAATRHDWNRDFKAFAAFRIIGEIKDYLRSLRWDKNAKVEFFAEGFEVAA
jgi:DNA-directed RNA polymerase specialized sigma subunit